MAAYAALVSLAQLIDQILPRDQDYAFICDQEQMLSLHQKTILLQKFLEYDSTNYLSSVVNVLESRIRDSAYQLEHIIESIICNQPAKTYSRLLLPTISCIDRNIDVTAVFFSCIAEIDIILEEAKEKNYPSAAHSSTTSSSRVAPTAEVTNVGLSNACTQMLDIITDQISSLQIIPITGMGGIGKTTLASAIYNDSRSLHHFDVRLWVTISQDYDLQEVLRGLLSTVKQNEQPDSTSIEDIHKYLKGRRFLIVIDDMWHEKAWGDVRNAFPDDRSGSRIIVTTRQLGVALYVSSFTYVHKMELLNEDQSWIMLREKVCGKEPCPAELDNIGRTISRNCKGLPLAIVVIAGILKRNKLKDYWELVAKNTNAAAATYNDQLFQILSLSYTYLPPQLKPCFLYIGAYPEDYDFQVKELVMLWTAEGFIKPRKSKTMEETAEEYIEELVERNILLVKEKTYNGKIKTFSIHDVLRDVSKQKAKEEKYVQRNSTSVQNIINDRYKVSSLKNDLHFNPGTYNAHLRSLKYTIDNINYSAPPSILCKIICLRYLYVVNAKYGQQPRHITFPESISKLQNLETFIARNENKNGSYTIPLDIWKLPRLRHIILGRYCNLQFPVANERDYPILGSLQTLIGVINANFSMNVIERIPNVKRMKLIYHYPIPREKNYRPMFSLSNLQHLHQLEELSINIEDDWIKPIHLLPDVSFPQNLKKLSLSHIQVPSMNIIGSLPYLEVLKLEMWCLKDDIWEPVQGEFLQLKCLKMKAITIKEWRVERIHFPCLQKLEIIRSFYLEQVPECVGEMETLQELVLNDCPKAKESVQKIQQNQQTFGNDSSLKITIID